MPKDQHVLISTALKIARLLELSHASESCLTSESLLVLFR